MDLQCPTAIAPPAGAPNRRWPWRSPVPGLDCCAVLLALTGADRAVAIADDEAELDQADCATDHSTGR